MSKKIHSIHSRDLNELVHDTTRKLLDAPKLDIVTAIEGHLFNAQLSADSCDYDLVLGRDIQLTKTRWTRLINDYLTKEIVVQFVSDAQSIYQGNCRDGATCQMQFNRPNRYIEARIHQWGNCLLAATYRGALNKKVKPTLTFYSRATYINHVGLLDTGIAYHLARMISGMGSNSISFEWHITSLQVNFLKSILYILSQPDLKKKIEKYERKSIAWKEQNISKAWQHLSRWHNRIITRYKEYGLDILTREITPYGPQRRICKRWLEVNGHLETSLPHVKISDLSILGVLNDKIKKKRSKLLAK